MEYISINEEFLDWRATWQDSNYLAELTVRQRERDFREGYMRGFEIAQKTPVYFGGIDPISDTSEPSISIAKAGYIERVIEGMPDEIREKLYDKELLKEMMNFVEKDKPEVNRVEVIQHSPPHNGRAYTNYSAKEVEVQYQDGGRTLKVFCK